VPIFWSTAWKRDNFYDLLQAIISIPPNIIAITIKRAVVEHFLNRFKTFNKVFQNPFFLHHQFFHPLAIILFFHGNKFHIAFIYHDDKGKEL
jgi:hypothetical protein